MLGVTTMTVEGNWVAPMLAHAYHNGVAIAAAAPGGPVSGFSCDARRIFSAERRLCGFY